MDWFRPRDLLPPPPRSPHKQGDFCFGGRFSAEPMKEKFELKRKKREGGKLGEQIKEKKIRKNSKEKRREKSC